MRVRRGLQTRFQCCILPWVFNPRSGAPAIRQAPSAGGYRGIATLRDLVFVWQTERHAEHFARQADGSWLLREYRGDDEMPIATLGGVIRLGEVYLAVFDPEG